MSGGHSSLTPETIWAATTRTLSAFDAAALGVPVDVWAATTRTLSADPATDAGAAALVWARATRTLTDLSLEEIADLPIQDSFYPSNIGVTTSATINTFGSWVELIANVGNGKRLLWVALIVANSAAASYQVELGEGAAGVEAAVARVAYHRLKITAVGLMIPAVYPLFRTLTDGARLTARARGDSAEAIDAAVSVGIA